MRHFLRAFAVVLFFASANLLQAAPPDPLSYIPEKAEFFIKLEKPRELIETVLKIEAVCDLLNLQSTRVFLDRQEARIAFDTLKYFETELKSPWPQLLDKLAGGGIAIAGRGIGEGNPSVVAVLQGTDAKFTAAFIDKVLTILESEVGTRGERKELRSKAEGGAEFIAFGEDLCIGRIGAGLFLSNKADGLRKMLEQILAAEGEGKFASVLQTESVKNARAMLPKDPYIWAWLNTEPLKKTDAAKELFAQPRNNFLVTFFFAGWLDVFHRSPFVAAALTGTKEGFDLNISLAAGRDGRAPDVTLHLPEDAKQPGTLPLLEPKGVLFSHSFYHDLGAMWTKRKQMFNADTAKDFENFEKQVSQVTLGTSLEKLFTGMGAHHRIVIVQQDKKSYKKQPLSQLPAFGHVIDLRDPDTGRSIESMVRAGGLLATAQFRLKMFDGKVGDVPYFGYRFVEGAEVAGDPDGYRFNFVPTFARLNDSFISATTPELCKELIELVQKESSGKASAANMQMRLFSDGLYANATMDMDLLVTQIMLEQGLNEKQAKQQAELLMQYVNKLGTVDLATEWKEKTFHFTASWKLKK